SMRADNTYLLMSLFLAFATYWPDFEFLIMFIIPVKVKWLALLDVLGLLAAVGTLPGYAKLMPVIAVGNYLLFFWPQLVELLKMQARRSQRAHTFQKFKRDIDDGR